MLHGLDQSRIVRDRDTRDQRTLQRPHGVADLNDVVSGNEKGQQIDGDGNGIMSSRIRFLESEEKVTSTQIFLFSLRSDGSAVRRSAVARRRSARRISFRF